MRYQLLTALCLLLGIFSPLAAQTSPELIVEETIGSPLQGQLTWLDDERLLVGTSAETRLYKPATSLEPIYTIPDGGNFTLIDDEIVLNGQRWDTTTGELLGEVETIRPSSSIYENTIGTVHYQLVQEGDIAYVQIDNPEASSLVAIPIFLMAEALALAFGIPQQENSFIKVLTFIVQIFSLPLIGSLPSSHVLMVFLPFGGWRN
jgi:hypothetical protein